LARIHGCTAPIVFCLCAMMVTMTSRAWRQSALRSPSECLQREDAGGLTARRKILWLAPLLTCLSYLDIAVGSMLRHPPNAESANYLATEWLLFWIWPKVIIVGFLFAGLAYLIAIAARWRASATRGRSAAADADADAPPAAIGLTIPRVFRRIYLFAALFLLQAILGGTTWIMNYGWPKWFTDYVVNWNYTVVKEGICPVWITTAHAAVGSLVLVAAFNLTVWSRRLLAGGK
jgi:heme a synthase